MAASVRVGCSGWAYDDWVGPFYRKGTLPRDYLQAYARTFDCVEVDSTFYRLPTTEMTARWHRTTPEGFRFAAKAPQQLTHDQRLRDAGPVLDRTYAALRPLREKLSCLLLQLPPSVTYGQDGGALSALLPQLRTDLWHAIEFRHPSWFCEEVYGQLRDAAVTLAWSENAVAPTPAVRTSDRLYLRMIGDRALTVFDRIQRERGSDLRTWWAEVRAHLDLTQQVLVFFNNHFAGFGPAGVNEFRSIVGQPPASFPGAGGAGQRSLAAFG